MRLSRMSYIVVTLVNISKLRIPFRLAAVFHYFHTETREYCKLNLFKIWNRQDNKQYSVTKGHVIGENQRIRREIH